MAAGKDQPQPVILHDPRLLVRRCAHLQQRRLTLAACPARLAAQPVQCLVACSRHDPAAWVRRYPGDGPALGSDRERLLDRIFSQIDIAEEADQGGDYATGTLPERPLESGRVNVRHDLVLGNLLERPDLYWPPARR